MRLLMMLYSFSKNYHRSIKSEEQKPQLKLISYPTENKLGYNIKVFEVSEIIS